ncbi:MAG TPA: head GIN domain-containing protein [Bacteroidales bacterium]|nr:head GIN domain-containing protein [Bacteroidales bacterium]
MMKRLRLLTASFLILAMAVACQAQTRKTVHGNNNVITKEREAGPFSGIKVSTGIDVYIEQGNEQLLKVEADENLHEYIMTEIKGDVMHIYTDANIRSAEKKRVYITMKEIKSVKASSAGDIIGESPIKTDKIEINASSAGEIKLEIVANDIEVKVSSSGDVTLSGEADNLEADLSSAGNLNAFNLKVREAEVSVSSAGDADVNVTESLQARASSAGDIHYTGNPGHVDAHSSSAGSIHKR